MSLDNEKAPGSDPESIHASFERKDDRSKSATEIARYDRANPLEALGLSLAHLQLSPVAEVAAEKGLLIAAAVMPGTCIPQSFVKRSRKNQEAVDAVMPSLNKPWASLWPHEKLARSFQTAKAVSGVAFTLNLSLARQQTLCGRADPARLMSHYINRELKCQFSAPLPYSFVFEFADSDRLHLHGVIVPIKLDQEHLRELDRALARAGGKTRGPQIVQSTQNRLNALPDGLGWFGYLQKSHYRTASLLGTNRISFVSQSLKRLCRQRLLN